MEELRKLIDVLERKGKGSASALINYTDSTSLETRLYQLAQSKTDAGETDLIGQLYNDTTKKGAFKMLKSRVKRKLYNQLFFLDTDNHKLANELHTVELECTKLLYLAGLLRNLHEAALAEQHVRKAISIAKNTCLVNCQIEGYEQLRRLLAENKYNRKEFDECILQLEKLYETQIAEREANSIFFDIRFDFKLGVLTYHKFSDLLKVKIERIKTLWEKTGSDLIFSLYHTIKIMYFELIGNPTATITHIQHTFNLYKSGKIHSLYYSINYNKFLLVFAYLGAKKYEEGIAEAEALKNNLETGSVNWFSHMENYFLLAMHSKNYFKAEEIIDEVLTNKYIQEITTFAKERWLIFYKFLNYTSGYTSSVVFDRKLKHVSQDKKGYNVWNLILDFVQVLEKKQPDLLQREIDRVRKFISKYLVAPEDARTKLFLKLLLIAGREYTDVKGCTRKGKYLFNKLQQTPAAGIAYAETEIIPYEHLWELILHKMKGK